MQLKEIHNTIQLNSYLKSFRKLVNVLSVSKETTHKITGYCKTLSELYQKHQRNDLFTKQQKNKNTQT